MDPEKKNRAEEIERKKQKLAEMRANKIRQDEERRQTLLGPIQNGNVSRRETASREELDAILKSVGVETSENHKSPPRVNGVEAAPAPVSAPEIIASRNLSLELTKITSTEIPVKDTAQYSKAIQTDDDRVTDREFSIGSQEFDFDDDMGMAIDSYRHRTHSHELDSPSTEDLAQLLPGYFARQKVEEAENVAPQEKKPEKLPELTEDEKQRIMMSDNFQLSFYNTSKIIERNLAVRGEVFTKYTLTEAPVEKRDELLVEAFKFAEKKWAANRSITAVDFCPMRKELIAVAYDQDKDRPHEPAGIVCIWNAKMDMGAPEFLFHCNSRLTSVAFARFHQHLVLAGCYSGQIAAWDFRVPNKKTPCNRSPLNNNTHTQPVFGLDVLGNQSSHCMISVSTEGKICTWNIDNLSNPVQSKELLNKGARAVPTMCVSYANDDRETFVVGAEDGKVFHFSRADITSPSLTAKEEYFGHRDGPVLAIHAHDAGGAVDFSHLFLTAGSDWNIKLWSTKDPHIRMTFEAHEDSVVDVKWSPIHPAVFASIDEKGFLRLWNLNENTENPILTLNVMNGDGLLRKLCWSENGRQLCLGDSKGILHVYDTHEVLHTAKNEEFVKFARVLADVKQDAEEEDRLLTRKGENIDGISSVAGVLAGASLAGRR